MWGAREKDGEMEEEHQHFHHFALIHLLPVRESEHAAALLVRLSMGIKAEGKSGNVCHKSKEIQENFEEKGGNWEEAIKNRSFPGTLGGFGEYVFGYLGLFIFWYF